MNKEFNCFDEMVEALEENEDMVECKECFDLFPKADCVKLGHAFICPTCNRAVSETSREPEVDFSSVTFDPYDQEFPEINDYDPGSIRDYESEPSLGDAITKLIEDEHEAIDGYEVADEIVQHASIPEDKKDEVLDTLDHIKEEEEEHIDELKELCPECDKELTEECTWVCRFKDQEIGTVTAKSEEEALEKMQKEYPEYPYGESDGCFEVCQEADCIKHDAITHPEDDVKVLNEDSEEDDQEEDAPELPEEESDEAEEEEAEEALDLDSAYEAALQVANESGVGQVFGYAKKDTEEFVAIEPFEVDDPEAVEQDLEAVYDDMAYAYVAYPQKDLEEALFEGAQLTEAGFFKNLFTKENQSLDAFFKNKFVVKTGNNTEGPYQWADAEKIAASKTEDTAVIIAKKVPVEELKNNWPIEIVNKLGGKDVQMATYTKGKATLNNEVSKLLTQIKAAAKGQKIAQKAGATTTTFNDPYGRTSLQDAVKDSPINPKGIAIHKMINMLFDHFTVSRGLSYSADAEASVTGKGIQTIPSGYQKEFDTFKDALTAATTASARKPDAADYDEFDSLPEGALTVVELYGHYKEFDAKIISKLDRYITRPEEVGLLDQAAESAGPVHLFTFSAGKAIVDTKCTAVDKYIEVKANIIEDLQDAGYDVSGEPGKAVKKNDDTDNKPDDNSADDNIDDDELDIPEETDVDVLRAAALKAMGTKLDAAGYTADSYKKYSDKFDTAIKFINNTNKTAADFEKYNFEKLRAKYEKLLEKEEDLDIPGEEESSDVPGEEETKEALESARAKAKETLGEKKTAEGYTEDSYETYSKNYDKLAERLDSADTVEALEQLTDMIPKLNEILQPVEEEETDSDTNDTNDASEEKLSEVSEEKLKKLYTAVTGQGVGDNKKWRKTLARIRGKLQELGESLDPKDYTPEDFMEESLQESDELLATSDALQNAAKTIGRMTSGAKNIVKGMKEDLTSTEDTPEEQETGLTELFGSKKKKDMKHYVAGIMADSSKSFKADAVIKFVDSTIKATAYNTKASNRKFFPYRTWAQWEFDCSPEDCRKITQNLRNIPKAGMATDSSMSLDDWYSLMSETIEVHSCPVTESYTTEAYDRDEEFVFYYDDLDYEYVTDADGITDALVDLVTDEEAERFTNGRFKTPDEICDYDKEHYYKDKKTYPVHEWTKFLEDNFDELYAAHEDEVYDYLKRYAKEELKQKREDEEAAEEDTGIGGGAFESEADFWRWKEG